MLSQNHASSSVIQKAGQPHQIHISTPFQAGQVLLSPISAHQTQQSAEYGVCTLTVCGVVFCDRVVPLTLQPLRLSKLITTGLKF